MQHSAQTITHSQDVHQQAALLDNWNQEYSQLGAGIFQGSVQSWQNHSVRLFSEQMNRAVFQAGSLPDNRIAFGVPSCVSGKSFICGEAVEANNLLIFSGSPGFEFLSPDNFKFFGIEIDPDDNDDPVMNKLIDALRWSFDQNSRVIKLNHQSAMLFTESLSTILKTNSHQSAKTNHRKEQALALDRQLIGTILDSMLAPSLHQDRNAKKWDIIRSIRELVYNNPCCPRTIAELTIELDVSRRTIQNACAEMLGVSPVQFLRALRLDMARRVIERGASVTVAATEYGFWHLGYFSKDYQNMFGELPSETHLHYQA